MKLTKNQKEEIRSLARLLYSHKEIAIILEIPLNTFKISMLDENSEIYKAYMAGFLESQLKIKENLIKAAERGSLQAQKMYIELLLLTNQKNIGFK